MTNEFTLKDNSSKPYAWILENVDLSIIDNPREYISTYARNLINGQNYSDVSDSEMFAAWMESGELDEAVSFIEMAKKQS